MISTESTPWKVPSGFELHWRTWDDEFVVYNTGSGDTHLLDPVAAHVLQVLEREPLSLTLLTGRVAASFELEQDIQLSSYLERLLSLFERLGLVERVEY